MLLHFIGKISTRKNGYMFDANTVFPPIFLLVNPQMQSIDVKICVVLAFISICLLIQLSVLYCLYIYLFVFDAIWSLSNSSNYIYFSSLPPLYETVFRMQLRLTQALVSREPGLQCAPPHLATFLLVSILLFPLTMALLAQ